MFTDRIGAAFSRPLEALVRALAPVNPDALTIIALLSNLTALQRVIYTYVELKRGWSGRKEDE
jgi:hypothetical protein